MLLNLKFFRIFLLVVTLFEDRKTISRRYTPLAVDDVHPLAVTTLFNALKRHAGLLAKPSPEIERLGQINIAMKE